MRHDYPRLAEKLSLLARPRIQVAGSNEGLTIELKSRSLQGDPLAAYRFECKAAQCDLKNADLIMGFSHFLEVAALKLEEYRPGKQPVAFAQDLYNDGYWNTPVSVSEWMNCEISHVDYDSEHWI